MSSYFKLAVFDFDYTIVNANSNNYLNKLIIKYDAGNMKNTTPSIAELNKFKYPTDIEQLHDRNNLTIRQNAIFSNMHANYKITKESMIKCLNEINIHDSMKQLFYFLKQINYDLIIISDSNTFLIETILRKNNLIHLFDPSVNKILANKSEFDQEGCLKIVPFNEIFNENGVEFKCRSEMCRKNMCKGAVLEEYIRKNFSKELNRHIIYVGDGQIDFCPGLKLNVGDTFFVKKNSTLSRLLEKDEYSNQIKSNIIIWKTASEIRNNLSLMS